MVQKNKGFTLFVVVLVGVLLLLPFFPLIANQVSMSTNTQLVRNLTVTPSAENVTLTLPHRALVTSITILNSTNVTAVNLVGAVFTTFIGNDGLQHVGLLLNGTAPLPYKSGSGTLNVSYIAQPNDFVDGATGGILNTILLFLSIGVLLWVITMIVKSDAFQKAIGRIR